MKTKSLLAFIGGAIGLAFLVLAISHFIHKRAPVGTGDIDTSPTVKKKELPEYPSDFANLARRPQPRLWEISFDEKYKKTPALLRRGKEIFEKRCATCHGDQGRGDSFMSQYLTATLPDFTKGNYKFKTTLGAHPRATDLVRSITAGFPTSGMPSFAHLPLKDRFGLAYYLMSFSPQFEKENYQPGKSIEMGESLRVSQRVLRRGEEMYKKLGCVDCHGSEGKGDGRLAGTLKDWRGNPSRPLDFTRGFAYFKSGHRPRDIYRTTMTGILTSGMPSYSVYLQKYSSQDLQSLAHYVHHLARRGESKIRQGWKEFSARWRNLHPMVANTKAFANRFHSKNSARFEKVDRQMAKKKGCLACHQNIHIIEGDTKRMGKSILALAGGRLGSTCVVCHEGDAFAHTKEKAHKNIFPDPGSMWVVSFGKGCAKCHGGEHPLTSLHGVKFPTDVETGPLQVVSKLSDPSGKTGHSHIYRMQRGQMSLEFGKASYVLQISGLVESDDFTYADFQMDDPLGPEPTVGTDVYKKWIAGALKRGEVERVERTRGFPRWEKLPAAWKKKSQKYIVEYYRKACGRCHIWNQGRHLTGEFRGSGCSSCHVIYSREGFYQGDDPTIPKDKAGHPIGHQITAQVSHRQCAHCHMAIYKHGNLPEDLPSRTGFGPEVHLDKGMECIDCHTSIDLHGDGNIYKSLQYQIEVRCSDCHGTVNKYPWELPLGDYRKGGKGRGTYKVCKKCEEEVDRENFCQKCKKKRTGKEVIEYMVTSRGNPRANLFKRGKKAFLKGRFTNREHPVTFLKDRLVQLKKKKWKKDYKPFHTNEKLVETHKKLECYACHSRQTSKCNICHLIRDKDKMSIDYIMSTTRFDPRTGWNPRYLLTPGKFTPKEVSKGRDEPFWQLGFPEILPGLRGTLKAFQPTCKPYVVTSKTVKGGNVPPFEKTVPEFHKLMTGDSRMGTPTPHDFSIKPRTCKDCHN